MQRAKKQSSTKPRGTQGPPAKNEWHEILVVQRTDRSAIVSIQHNSKMILDDDAEDAIEECRSQIDWDGAIWSGTRVLAVFLFRVRDKQFHIVLPEPASEATLSARIKKR